VLSQMLRTPPTRRKPQNNGNDGNGEKKSEKDAGRDQRVASFLRRLRQRMNCRAFN
jgi:hypothetical protein